MDLEDITAILMVKQPRPGMVKTRLVGDGRFSPHAACELAWAMLECLVERLEARMPIVLAVTPDGSCGEVLERLRRPELPVVNQGPGNLGARMSRAWQATADRPVAFFGIDSPDVPGDVLQRLPAALASNEVVIGPTHDGGYWTLGSRDHRPELLHEIDWGSSSVYDQTRRRARAAGLTCSALPVWYDVDRPGDVAALHRRLVQEAGVPTGPESALARLSDRVSALLRDPRTSPRDEAQ